MNWNQGYTATYYAEILDADSWRGIERFEIAGGKVNRSSDGLRCSADIDCRKPIGEKYIRIWMDTRQDGSSAHTALFTGLTSQPETSWDGYIPTRSLECYSVLKAADDVHLQRGWYAPAGINAGTVIKRLLDATPAPLEIIGDMPNLKTSIVGEDEESHLTMTDKILTAVGWSMRILGDGTIQLYDPSMEKSVQRFSPSDNDSIEPKIIVKDDWFSCPNVFQAIADDLTATVRDDNPSSFLSTINRGREIWMTEGNADLGEHESIGQYAWRRLKEEQSRAFVVNYDRRFDPAINVGSIITLTYSAQGISGDFRVQSQSIELGYGARTSEEVCAIEH